MKITLLTNESIRLEPSPGQLTVEAPSYDQSYSPYHMVASGLASCSHGVLTSWATHAHLDSNDLALEVSWSFADAPNRIGEMTLAILWPSLPEERRAAAERAAALCPIHRTLSKGTAMKVEVRR